MSFLSRAEFGLLAAEPALGARDLHSFAGSHPDQIRLEPGAPGLKARAADVARAAPCRQPLQQLLLDRAVQPLDLPSPSATANTPRSSWRRTPVRASLCSIESAANSSPRSQRRKHRHPAELSPRRIDGHRHPQRRQHLRLRRVQRDRPPHDQPRELIDERRHPRPLRALRPRRQDRG